MRSISQHHHVENIKTIEDFSRSSIDEIINNFFEKGKSYKENLCIRCSLKKSVRNSHTISQYLLRDIESKSGKNKSMVCRCNFSLDGSGKISYWEYPISKATAYGLFCEDCEIFFNEKCENYSFDLKDDRFLENISQICRRLAYAHLFKKAKIIENSESINLTMKKIRGFLLSRGADRGVIDRHLVKMKSEFKNLVENAKNIDHSSIFEWCDTDNDKKDIIIYVSKSIPIRIGEMIFLTEVKQKSIFCSSTKVVINGDKKDVIFASGNLTKDGCYNISGSRRNLIISIIATALLSDELFFDYKIKSNIVANLALRGRREDIEHQSILLKAIAGENLIEYVKKCDIDFFNFCEWLDNHMDGDIFVKPKGEGWTKL